MFDQFVGIDYSGASTADKRNAAIQVFSGGSLESEPGSSRLQIEVKRVVPPIAAGSRGGKHWSRRLVYRWLREVLVEYVGKRTVLIGIDHAFSFPKTYFDRYGLSDWDDFLSDFGRHWPTDRDGVHIDDFREKNPRTGQASELRLADNWTAGAKSVFQFDVQGSVAKSTHAGLPFLKLLRDEFAELHVWPFDGWLIPDGASVICETFPTLFRRRFPRQGRTVDQQDAFAIASWMQEMQHLGRLNEFFDPPLSDAQKLLARTEGWILGAW